MYIYQSTAIIMSIVSITDLNVSKITFGKLTVPKTGKGAYINITYEGKPLMISYPLMFSWGAAQDTRNQDEAGSSEKFNLNIQFPRASDTESNTEEIQLALQKTKELEKAIHDAAEVHAAKWFNLVEDENGNEVPLKRNQITLGHPKGGAILKYKLDRTGATPKLIKNNPEVPPGIKFKLQKDNKTGLFRCSVFDENCKLLYCPQDARGTIPEEIVNADIFALMPKFSKVKCIASFTIWIQGTSVMPTFTLEQALCYKPENLRQDLTQCLFGAPTAEEHKQMQSAAAVATATAVADVDNGTSDGLQIEDSDDDADIVEPIVVAKKATPVVVPAAVVPTPAHQEEDDEEVAPKAAATTTKKVVKKIVTRSATKKDN